MAYELSTQEHDLLLEALDVLTASAKRAINAERSKAIREIRELHYADIARLNAIMRQGDFTGPNYKPTLIPKEEIETPKRR